MANYINKDLELSIEAKESSIVLRHNDKVLLTVPLSFINKYVESKLDRPMNRVSVDEFRAFMADYQAYLDLEMGFEVEQDHDYDYGEDADGNRGQKRVEYKDIEFSKLNVKKVNLSLQDEYGLVLCENISLLEIVSDNNEFIEFVLKDINENLEKYV